jgi:hypothetical protein
MDETADEKTLWRRSESFRHQCEVRWLLRKIDAARDKKRASDEYIALVRKARGDVAADKLVTDSRSQWGKGNRGLNEDWL